MKSLMELQIPGQPQFVRVARLAVSGTASCAGFGVEEIDEIKQSVGEACSNAVIAVQRAGEGQITIRCYLENHSMFVEVSPVEGLRSEEEGASFQFFLIKTLMDDVEIVANGTGKDLLKMKRSLAA